MNFGKILFKGIRIQLFFGASAFYQIKVQFIDLKPKINFFDIYFNLHKKLIFIYFVMLIGLIYHLIYHLISQFQTNIKWK